MKKSYKAPQCEVLDLCTENILLVNSPYSGYEGDNLYLRTADEEEKVTYRVHFGDYAD